METHAAQRIALVTETFPPEINGVALTVQSMLHELCEAGRRVLLVRPRQKLTQAGEKPRRYAELLVPGAALPLYSALRFGWPARAKLRQSFRDLRIQGVYVATEGPLGYSAIGAARDLGIPVCAGFHTRFDDYLKHYGLSFLQPLALAWLRHFHNRADCTLVPTSELRDWLQSAGLTRVALLTRAVDTTFFTPSARSDELRRELGVAPDDLLLIHVGRIAAEKNLALLHRCCAAIRARHPSARMVWVGDGPQKDSMRASYPEQIFVGSQRGPKLAAYYASADLFLFPSLSETFGNVTLEAMASGLDLCAFDYGAAREHGRDAETAWLAPFGDASIFLAQALAAADAVVRGQGLGSNARAAVAHLNPQSVALGLLDVFAGILAQQQTMQGQTATQGGQA